VTYYSAEEAEAARARIEQNTGTTSALQSWFASVSGFVAASPAKVSVLEHLTYTRSGLTDAEFSGVIAGCIIGGTCLIIALVLYGRFLRRRRYSSSRKYKENSPRAAPDEDPPTVTETRRGGLLGKVLGDGLVKVDAAVVVGEGTDPAVGTPVAATRWRVGHPALTRLTGLLRLQKVREAKVVPIT